jgi:predicted NBD/HSP70 family sugar kinase
MLAKLVPAHVPVVVGNDADLAVVAEHIRGGGRGCDDLVFLMGRTGVGAGIIVNGVQLRGHDGHAGEIGHNVVDVSGPICHCGKRGCLETFVGDQALLTLAGRCPTDDPATVFAAAREGVPAAAAAVGQVGVALGRAIAGLVNTLNPERVMLGGSFSDVLDIARGELEKGFDSYVLDAPGESVVLCKPDLGEDSALLGAAEIAFGALLADPLGGRALAAR